jgi:hypothetical protein
MREIGTGDRDVSVPDRFSGTTRPRSGRLSVLAVFLTQKNTVAPQLKSHMYQICNRPHTIGYVI